MRNVRLRRSRDAGRDRPSFRTELGRRLESVLDRFESRQKAASVAGVSTDQLPKYVRGDAKPAFEVLARLAHEVGVSLDWLATGQGSMPVNSSAPELSINPGRRWENEQELKQYRSQAKAWDRKLMRLCGVTVLELLDEFDKTMEPAALMDLVLAIYDLQMQRREQGQEDLPVAEIVRLVRRAT